jgi:ferredoxin
MLRPVTPEDSPNYQMSDHWWGMLINIPKCIGCGNCVRACATENDVPDGNFRTWVERYHVTDTEMTTPEVISPDGGKEGFPVAQEDAGKYFFVPKMCNHCADSPVHAGVPGGRDLHQPGRGGAGGPEILPGLRVLRAGLPVWLPLPASHEDTWPTNARCAITASPRG